MPFAMLGSAVDYGQWKNGVNAAGLLTAIGTSFCLKVGSEIAGFIFCEIVTTDYADGTILLGHDGPFHIAISDGKPILRGMGVYHGKKGSDVSVEAKLKTDR